LEDVQHFEISILIKARFQHYNPLLKCWADSRV